MPYNGRKYEKGGNLANGFDARCTTQIINPLSTGHNSPPFLYLLLPNGFYKLNSMIL